MDYEEKARVGAASYDAFNRGDLETLVKLYDPECEWRMSNYPSWPENPVYRGREGLSEFFDGWLDPWEEYHCEATQVTDLPGDRLFVVASQSGRGRHSGAEVEMPPFGQVIDFRDGRILCVDNWADLDEARKAVGLPE